jgi:hypothetical protein
VKPLLRQAGACERPLEPLQDVGWLHRSTDRVREYQAALAPLIARSCSLERLPVAMHPQGGDQRGWHRQGAAAFLRFGFLKREFAVDPLEGIADPKGAAVEVDVLPMQPRWGSNPCTPASDTATCVVLSAMSTRLAVASHHLPSS